MTNKSLILLALSALSFSSVQAQSLLVGWDRFKDPAAGTTTNSAGFAAADFSGSFTVSGTTETPDWARSSEGSNDGTFGVFAGADNTKTTNFLGALSPVNVDADGITLSFTIQNDSLVDYALSSVEFDVWRSFNNSPSTVDVNVTSGSITNGLIATTAAFTEQGSGGLDTNNGNNYEDISITLASLADGVLEAGQSATFAIIVNDQNITNGASIYFDNIGITGTAIPEPSSYAMIAGLLALTSIMMRRRT